MHSISAHFLTYLDLVFQSVSVKGYVSLLCFKMQNQIEELLHWNVYCNAALKSLFVCLSQEQLYIHFAPSHFVQHIKFAYHVQNVWQRHSNLKCV